jgi:Leucine-rich repeat (LRR) protein
MSSLTSLTTLDMQGNELPVVPSGISELTSLRYLRLRGNYLVGLPDGISNLVNLEVNNPIRVVFVDICFRS